MKKKLMIILVAAFLGGSLGLNAQVVNTDVPTEEEFEEFAEYGEMMWKRILYGDNMVTKRVVLKEEKNE